MIFVMGNLGEIKVLTDLEMMGKGMTELNFGREKMGKYLLLGEYLLRSVSGMIMLIILRTIGILLLGKFQVSGVFKPVGMMRRGTC